MKYPIANKDHTRGPRDGRVALLEYGDYQCPYSAEAQLIVNALQTEIFPDDLIFIYRHLPLTDIHPDSEMAAIAAEAAAMQGKFWEMHELLFENQERLDRNALLDYAAECDLDLDEFEAALDSKPLLDRVLRDLSFASDENAESTPTFFINGKLYDGPTELESLAEAIQEVIEDRHRRVA